MDSIEFQQEQSPEAQIEATLHALDEFDGYKPAYNLDSRNINDSAVAARRQIKSEFSTELSAATTDRGPDNQINENILLTSYLANRERLLIASTQIAAERKDPTLDLFNIPESQKPDMEKTIFQKWLGVYTHLKDDNRDKSYNMRILQSTASAYFTKRGLIELEESTPELTRSGLGELMGMKRPELTQQRIEHLVSMHEAGTLQKLDNPIDTSDEALQQKANIVTSVLNSNSIKKPSIAAAICIYVDNGYTEEEIQKALDHIIVERFSPESALQFAFEGTANADPSDIRDYAVEVARRQGRKHTPGRVNYLAEKVRVNILDGKTDTAATAIKALRVFRHKWELSPLVKMTENATTSAELAEIQEAFMDILSVAPVSAQDRKTHKKGTLSLSVDKFLRAHIKQLGNMPDVSDIDYMQLGEFFDRVRDMTEQPADLSIVTRYIGNSAMRDFLGNMDGVKIEGQDVYRARVVAPLLSQEGVADLYDALTGEEDTVPEKNAGRIIEDMTRLFTSYIKGLEQNPVGHNPDMINNISKHLLYRDGRLVMPHAQDIITLSNVLASSFNKRGGIPSKDESGNEIRLPLSPLDASRPENLGKAVAVILQLTREGSTSSTSEEVENGALADSQLIGSIDLVVLPAMGVKRAQAGVTLADMALSYPGASGKEIKALWDAAVAADQNKGPLGDQKFLKLSHGQRSVRSYKAGKSGYGVLS